MIFVWVVFFDYFWLVCVIALIQETLHVVVQDVVTSKQTDVTIKRNNMIKDMKVQILAKEGIPIDKQTIIFNGRPLQYLNKRFHNMHVQQGSTFYMFDRRLKDSFDVTCRL